MHVTDHAARRCLTFGSTRRACQLTIPQCARWSRVRAIWAHGIAGWELSISAGKAFTTSPISSSRIRTAFEYQAVGQVTSLQVRADGIDRRLNVGQSLPYWQVTVPPCHVRYVREQRASGRLPTPGPPWCQGWPPARPGPGPARAGPCPVASQRAGPRYCRARPRRELRCRRPAGLSRHGAAAAVTRFSPLSPDLPPYRAGQPAQLRGLMLDIDHEVASGRIDQLTVEEFKVPARAAIEDRTDLVHALAQGDCEGRLAGAALACLELVRELASWTHCPVRPVRATRAPASASAWLMARPSPLVPR